MGESITAAIPKAGKREWIGLAVIALPCLLYSMDLTVLHLAVPRLTEALAPSSVQLLWIIDIYGFLLAGSLITMGTLGETEAGELSGEEVLPGFACPLSSLL
jgi:DHA2 family multidrug resistance protein-like MFS transporter